MTKELIRLAARELSPHTRQQRLLLLLGTLLLASSAVHGVIAVVAALNGAAWAGSVSWRKPVLFAFSFGLLLLSAAGVMRQLPDRRRTGWCVAVLVGGSSVLEVVLITGQRWRGRASHFNSTTTVDSAVWSAMSLLVALTVIGLLVLLVWVARDLRHDGSRLIAAVLGIVGVLVAGYIGKDMAAKGERVFEQTGRPPEEMVFGAAGSPKVAHALGLHSLQVLIVLAVLLGAGSLRPAARTAALAFGAMGYAALFGAVTTTAYAGRSLTDPGTGPLLVGIAGVATLLGTGVVAVAALRGTTVRTGRVRQEAAL